MHIRPAEAEDLDTLEAWRPTGLTRWHAARFGRQIDGGSTYLIAWATPTEPVGVCSIKWTGCDVPEVAAALPGCPELSGLEVWPESRRGEGIGAAIITDVERRVRDRGIPQLGLGVDDENAGAGRLYVRLGYRDAGIAYLDRWSYVTDDGVTHAVADPCRFLVKDL